MHNCIHQTGNFHSSDVYSSDRKYRHGLARSAAAPCNGLGDLSFNTPVEAAAGCEDAPHCFLMVWKFKLFFLFGGSAAPPAGNSASFTIGYHVRSHNTAYICTLEWPRAHTWRSARPGVAWLYAKMQLPLAWRSRRQRSSPSHPCQCDHCPCFPSTDCCLSQCDTRDESKSVLSHQWGLITRSWLCAMHA